MKFLQNLRTKLLNFDQNNIFKFVNFGVLALKNGKNPPKSQFTAFRALTFYLSTSKV